MESIPGCLLMQIAKVIFHSRFPAFIYCCTLKTEPERVRSPIIRILLPGDVV
jgi:hypothetical protein